MNNFVIKKTNVEEFKNRLQNFNYNGIETILGNNEALGNSALKYAQTGDCYIGLKDEEMLGCGGIVEFCPKNGFVWLLMNKEIKFYSKSILKFMKTLLDYLFVVKNFVRLQCFCLADTPEAPRLLEHLKFKQEGRLRKFAQSKDCFIYGLIREDL